MPLQSTSGAASYDAFGGGAAAKVNYIEDFFQSYLRTGTGASATVTTGLDGSTKETLVWTKSRSAATNHKLTDNVRGVTKALSSNTTGAEATDSQGLTAFSATGYTIGTNTDYNNSGATYVDWQWIAQPKFFDVVTFTGTQNSSGTGQVVSHNLGSTPGCVIIKPITDTSGTGFSIADWIVWHRSLPSNSVFLKLNSSASQNGSSDKIQAVSSTTFTAGWEVGYTGQQYVAYLFAHNAGGFGLTGTDNVISCGSFDGTANTAVTLGYEPQWIMFKNTTSTSNWQIIDNMRGMVVSSDDRQLLANSSNAEGDNNLVSPTATGFTWIPSAAGNTYIYIAIRRGPMKVPTSGTSVYNAIARTGTGAAATITGVGFPTDLVLSLTRNFSGTDHLMVDRVRGSSAQLFTNLTAAESTNATSVTSLASNDGISVGTDYPIQSINYASGYTYVTNFFRRAPSFFDEVCYTGTGVANTAFTHNLTVTPELMIVKPRSAATAPNWRVWSPINSTDFNLLQLSTNGAASSSLYSSSNVFPAIPTATTFTVGGSGSIQLNESGQTFVAYLFATCAGVSKCGTFTGNGSSQTINCGFTGGARFVMIKATSTTGDWMVADSARGIVSGSDPYLELNNTNAEVTGEDWLDTDSTGFVVNEVSGSNANTNGVTYIFLAIA